jgi:acetyl-CoA synthetase
MKPLFTSKTAWIQPQDYSKKYLASIVDPENFWAELASEFLHWEQSWDSVLTGSFNKGTIRWFEGGVLNASTNCIDRHLETRGDQIALIWQGDSEADVRQFTYYQLHTEVCRFANVLLSLKVQKGDRVCLYLPMIPEAAFAMLACARIGAIHSVVFAGFSAEALRSRIVDLNCKVVITADHSFRGGKTIPLKANVDEAIHNLSPVEKVLMIKRSGLEVAWNGTRDVGYDDLAKTVSSDCKAVAMNSEDPLFILYTSGSTGKPKGMVHTTAGYLLHVAVTHQYVFDYHEGDVYWCTADLGWITGHSYLLYGPLLNGATTLMFEGIPTYPDPSRFWSTIDKFNVNQFYTAPTALRMLISKGDEWLASSRRDSLRILGTVGEPINPEVWQWYFKEVGKGICPIVDTWWQTETGGHMITPLPYASNMPPGSAAQPFFGVAPGIVDDQNHLIEGVGEGRLVIKQSWPGIARTIYGDHARYLETYFTECRPYYVTGDSARRDADGNYWIQGRVDDNLKVSGHLLGTAELESALVSSPDVAEAAVVGFAHPIKGQGIYAFVTLMQGVSPSEALKKELMQLVRQQIGAIAMPDLIQFAPSLPKTRSGKIMRRILRKIAEGKTDDLGDLSTLAEPEIVLELIAGRLSLPE